MEYSTSKAVKFCFKNIRGNTCQIFNFCADKKCRKYVLEAILTFKKLYCNIL